MWLAPVRTHRSTAPSIDAVAVEPGSVSRARDAFSESERGRSPAVAGRHLTKPVDPEPTASTKDVPRSDTPAGEVTDARNA